MGKKKKQSTAMEKGRGAHSRPSPLRARPAPALRAPQRAASRRTRSGAAAAVGTTNRRGRGQQQQQETRPASVFTGSLATGYGGGPRTRSSYYPDSDPDEFDLLVGREAAGTGGDEEEQQHISDYLAGFLSDGEYSIPMDGGQGGDGFRDYAGKADFAVRDHVAEGYKEYPNVSNDAANYSDNDDQAFVGNGPVTVVAAEDEEEGALQQLDDAQQTPEYYPVVGEAECYGNSTEAAFDGGEDDGCYGQDGNSMEAAFNGGDDDGYYGQDDVGGGDWYDQGYDGYAHDDDSDDPFY